jgi:hypothetical protein
MRLTLRHMIKLDSSRTRVELEQFFRDSVNSPTRPTLLMDLWQKFHLFLLLLQHFCLKLEKILALWEKVLYLLLLYLSFSEFPNRLRPLCTTMPWTIWPVLVVLWGVCWMFYEELSWNWGDQGELPTAGSTTRLFEDIGHTNLSQGNYASFPFFSIRH